MVVSLASCVTSAVAVSLCRRAEVLLEGDAVRATSVDVVGATPTLRRPPREPETVGESSSSRDDDRVPRPVTARALAAAAIDLDAEVRIPVSPPAVGGETGWSTRRRFAPDREAPRLDGESFETAPTPTLSEADPRRARVVLVAGAGLEVFRVCREGVGLTIARGEESTDGARVPLLCEDWS
jgi:hypothetical protein